MLKKEKFIKEQKEFAEMLGMSLDEYIDYCKENKVKNHSAKSKKQHDDSILKQLGLSNKDLLIR